jgi:glycine betaine/choline ABC-type transport system substrate-binding protein
MRLLPLLAFCCGTLLLVGSGPLAAAEPIRIASKNFNESYVLAEIVAQLLEEDGLEVERRFGLGGTLICYEALVAGEIDIYVEYTGTLSQAILGRPEVVALEALNSLVAERGIQMLDPFGFNNTYAMATPRAVAEARNLRGIGDLANHPDLSVVVSHEFLEREDGWQGLARTYGLTSPVRGIEHGLAYQAIAEGSIDVTDAYSTDGELQRYDLVVLTDDQGYFPRYLAAPLVRRAVLPVVGERLARLAGSMDDDVMQALNAAVVFGGQNFAEVANGFLVGLGMAAARDGSDRFWSELATNTLQHLKLTVGALTGAVLVGVGDLLLRAAADHPVHRAVGADDSSVRHRRGSGHHRPVPLLAAAHPAQLTDGAHHPGSDPGPGGCVHGVVIPGAAAVRLRTPVAAEHLRWYPNRRGDQHRHRDSGRVHRCRRVGGSHRDRTGVERCGADPGGRGARSTPGGGYRAAVRGVGAVAAARSPAGFRILICRFFRPQNR